MKRQLIALSLMSLVVCRQISAKGFTSSVKSWFNSSNSTVIINGKVISSSGDVVVIDGKVVSPEQSDDKYPKSTAPAKVVEHKEENKKYNETYNYDTYHQVQATYPFKEGGRVEVENPTGEVCIETSDDTDAIKVDVTLDPPVLQYPITTTVAVDPVTGRASIKSVHHKQPIHIAAITRITVPRKTSVDVVTVSGDVIAHNRIGSSDLCTTSGDISACNLTGSARMHSVSGSIETDNVAGEIDLKTVSGRINASNMSAEHLLRIVSVSGSIYAYIRSIKNARNVEISAVSGDLKVTIPRSLDAVIKGITTSGRISGNVWQQFTGRRNNQAEAILGNGSLRMNMHTVSGNIYANFNKN